VTHGTPARIAIAVAVLGGCEEARSPCTLAGDDLARSCRLELAVIDSDGRVRLAPAGAEGRATHGTIACELSFITPVQAITLRDPDAPVIAPPESAYPSWGVVFTDIVTQVRFRHKDGSVGEWLPRDVLSGGDFADSDASGIPDLTRVLVGPDPGWSYYADVATFGPPPPDAWFTLASRGDFASAAELPSVASDTLHLGPARDGVQYLATMAKTLIPPETTWTLSGWNRYDVPGIPGVMSRFNEIDLTGDPITKYALVADDVVHVPTGSTGWTWRAFTFTTEPATVGLTIVPARVNATAGAMWAAGWELREQPVYGHGKVVFAADFTSLDPWEASDPTNTHAIAIGGVDALELDPPPHEIATATSRAMIPVTGGRLYAFHVAMENRAFVNYDRTHDTWVTCYLEFYDAQGVFLDYVKTQATRPVFERPVGAAMIAPPNAQFARFVLVAAHTSFAPNPIDKTMSARFGALWLEESTYDPAFETRPSGWTLSPPADPDATALEIRSRLLSHDRVATPSFGGYEITSAGCKP